MLPVLATDTVTGDLARAVGYALLWGLEGVALRSVGGERVPFVNEAALRRRLEENEMPAAAVDPGLFEGAAADRAVWLNDVAAFEDTAAFCARVGCRVVRVGALARDAADGDATGEARAAALRALGDAASRHGLRLAVRNEARTAVATGADLARLLAAVGHAAVGADWHPADARQAGEDAIVGLDALLVAGSVACVAVRDDAAADDGVRVDVPVGEGDGQWPAQLAHLAAAGYAGPLVLDVPGRPAGAAGLASGSALVRLARAAVRAARRTSPTTP